jgi:hypothetical protein
MVPPIQKTYDNKAKPLHHPLYPRESRNWATEIAPNGILAWELDPEEGFQKLYLLR